MAITWQNVVGIAPQLKKTDPTAQAMILAIVAAQINVVSWGALADAGSTYLAAHLGELAKLRGSGQVTQESVGQLSRSYATVKGINGSLGLTSYGAEYQRLIYLLPTSLGAVY